MQVVAALLLWWRIFFWFLCSRVVGGWCSQSWSSARSWASNEGAMLSGITLGDTSIQSLDCVSCPSFYRALGTWLLLFSRTVNECNTTACAALTPFLPYAMRTSHLAAEIRVVLKCIRKVLIVMPCLLCFIRPVQINCITCITCLHFTSLIFFNFIRYILARLFPFLDENAHTGEEWHYFIYLVFYLSYLSLCRCLNFHGNSRLKSAPT